MGVNGTNAPLERPYCLGWRGRTLAALVAKSVVDPRWRRWLRDASGSTWKLLSEAANLLFPWILKLLMMKPDSCLQKN